MHMHVYMCLCTRICVYITCVCVCACICACVCVCVHAHLYVCAYAYGCVCSCVCLYVHMRMAAYTYALLTCMCMLCVHTCLYECTCMHVRMYVICLHTRSCQHFYYVRTHVLSNVGMHYSTCLSMYVCATVPRLCNEITLFGTYVRRVSCIPRDQIFHVFMRKHAQAIRIGNIWTRATNLPFHVDGYKILALFHNHGKLLEIATQLFRKEG